MKIDKIIKSKRIEKGLTQEQVANYLNVSTPAVNKWENGITHPDITILPILGRLLEVDMNTLLSFKEELSEDEIGHFVNKITDIITKEGYEKGYSIAMDKMKEYPNSDLLIYSLVSVLEGALHIFDVDSNKKEEYENELNSFYKKLSSSDNYQIKEQISSMLILKYLQEKELGEAKKLIDNLEYQGADKQLLQSRYYIEKEEYLTANKILQQKIYTDISNVFNYITILSGVAMKEDEREYSKYLADFIYRLAKLFDFPEFMANSGYLSVAIDEKNTEKTLEYTEKILESTKNGLLYFNSPIFKYIEKKDYNNPAPQIETVESMTRKMIIKSLKEDEELAFLRGDEKFKELILKYENL